MLARLAAANPLPHSLRQSTPQGVLRVVTAVIVVALAWVALRWLARRGVSWAARAYRVLQPQVTTLGVWCRFAPATVAYTVLWTGTSILQQGSPAVLADALARLNSTNLEQMAHHPVRVLLTSSFLVADYGVGYPLYVLGYAMVVARLEHRLGTARALGVWLAAHVLGSLLTVALESRLLAWHLVDRDIAVTTDIGVSYVLAGSAGALLLLVSRRTRPWYATALAVVILGPVAVSHSIWDVGHLFATLCGLGAGWLLLRRTPADHPIVWRDVAAAARAGRLDRDHPRTVPGVTAAPAAPAG